MKRTPVVRCVIAVLLLLFPCSAARAADPQPFELKDGDIVAFIGNTFVEREQTHSYFETLLRTRWPDRKISFRNLGWSGDNVFGASRGYFEGADAGFARLTKIVHDVKPTAIFISYGMGESFEGEAGLPAFRSGLERMLDMLKDLNARQTVLIGPIRHEDLGPPLPSPAEHNKWLRAYADAMKDVAKQRGHRFVDLYDILGDGVKANPPAPLTANGIHLTQYGYWRAAGAIAKALGAAPGGERTTGASGPDGVYTTRVLNALLPACPPPAGGPRTSLPDWARVMRFADLAPGQYVLTANGEPVVTASAEQWKQGVEILDDPPAKTAEKIRQLSVQKNIQFFNQWRPANETYIFGFRAHEQGKNAAEMPQFTEPITRLEDEITRLAQPVETIYELKPQ